MRLPIVGFIIFQILAVGQSEGFGTRTPPRKARNNEKELLEASESRQRSAGDYQDRDYGDHKEEIARKDFDLAITFKAPHYEAHDYWRHDRGYHNRRTFFEGFSNGKTTTFPGFYQLMTSVFGGGEEAHETIHYNRHRTTPPFGFDFGFNPTEPNYIPSPKPIRASVIKLETITRSPIYPPPFEYVTTVKYYPHVGSVTNYILNDNPKAQQSAGYHPEEPIPQVKIPSFKPLSVLPKPEFFPPTTTRPTYAGYFNNRTRSFSKYYNRTDYKYPESVQDKLPHLNLRDVEIPYVSEKPVPQIFDPYSKEISRERQFGFTPDFFPPSRTGATTNALGLIDIRSLNSPGRTDSENKERPNGSRAEFDVTTIKSFPGAVEKVKRPTFKNAKKLTAQLDKSSIERVANLTVEGFSKVEKDDSGPRKNFNYFNVRELIDYEMDKLENVSRPIGKQSALNDSSTRPVNLNDEFSLDAKILKDTNWDGLTVPHPLTTAEESGESTTLPVQRFEPKPKTKTAFWEAVEEQTTSPPNPPTSEELTEATTEQNLRMTTEIVPWPTAPEVTESNEPDTTVEPTTRRISGTGKNSAQRNRDFLKPATEAPEWIDSTTSAERTTFRRRYSRRPKIVNFTPYPTPEELQRKLINRNYFPKRSKPNITISFGNKDVLKNRQIPVKEELMKFSDEDVRKRRKIGKRRQVYKRVRMTTSERPIKDN